MTTQKQPQKRGGGATSAVDDPRYISVSTGATKRRGIPIPQPNPDWHPSVQSWYRALALSGQSEFYEASDWATAVAAAQAYNIFLKTYNASVFASFVRLSERLGVTVVDRKRSRIELTDGDVTDADEEAADRTIIEWQGRLGVVRQQEP